jgi:hypothetical protein
VAVIIPFRGDAGATGALAEIVRTLAPRQGDEILIADNSEEEVLAGRTELRPARVIECDVKRSAYAARNIGAEHSDQPWLLYLDADCRPQPGLLDAYFDPPPADDVGAVAGRILGSPDQTGLAPRYARTRRFLDPEPLLESHPHRRMAVTANLLVRRSAWEEVGGFHEQTLSAADADFCWRMQDAGWRLDYRPGAEVLHLHRDTLRALLAQAFRDGAGERWLSRRWPGVGALVAARQHLTALVGPLAWLLRGRLELARLKLVDALWIAARDAGSLADNRPGSAPGSASTVVFTEEFPAPADPLVRELAGAVAGGDRIRVEAVRRPARADWRAGRALPATLLEDDGPLRRVAALAALFARNPRRVARALNAAGNSRLGLPALAPAARRLARDAPDAVVRAPESLQPDAVRLTLLAGRPGDRVRPLGR